jgi:hypothetical protein
LAISENPAVVRRPQPSTTVASLDTARGRRPARSHRLLLIAAAVLIASGIGAGGFAIGRSDRTTAHGTALHAILSPQPGSSAAAVGKATITPSVDGYTLSVSTRDLPARNGYYEVWLYNPSINQMVAVGSLGTGAAGRFTVPAGLDLNAYHLVDLSAQNYDGNNRHEQSVLRGPLQN